MKTYSFIFFIIFITAISCQKNSQATAERATKTEINDSKHELESAKASEVANISVISKTEQKHSEEKEDCKEVEVIMGSGRECIIQNTALNKAYQNIIKNKKVEESDYFLREIPNTNKSVAVNKNGLISIDYEISKNKVAISMNYEGGVTEVTLEKINNTVKRSIYHYAD
ncbi:hypothetical protein [Flavobacterium sp. RS13.1]|uniref:hypothetical protein n=1 Tax=Flavobacterium sp. RS13.1 TaxID=3400345 RepID=UPI003AAD1221